ncbi:TatD family hydrolase [Loktanella salsilacus]|jgi:TatD DNase family protein|uniref:TatD family hydrolase n=1 Tax=Loktanella salsilacus TaxID=195913 RepID=UPI001ECA6D48|nr:TatD family hydrolase [Loktanella salsilacus]MBU0780903.1 TatD family hydrolase [Alphaproteobacteria bacterium]MBU0860759.1 TatD family hydrolase [Alphaproteobacteria bacterium]MBU1835003.1 TatD family hydrolase [Alphaproteobacteria bacterium]UTH43472.1 TatD family hydrolase [Loktanella salsilacus]
MTLPILVDAHCHLDFPDFDDERSAVIDRARAAGVTRMVTICTKLPNAPRVAAIADAYDGVFWAAGVHPMSVGEHAPVTVEELVTLAQHPKFVGIGETGLDYHYTAETKAAQQDSLRLHIEACRQTKLPLIIHARDADDDMARILREEYDAGKYTCMMHCFSSTRALAEAALDMDFYLSMSGIAAFPKSKELRDIFKDAPLDRILTETDSPYLAPPPFRGRRNEPAYTAHTAQVGADTFELSLDDFAKATSANFDRLFWKAA